MVVWDPEEHRFLRLAAGIWVAMMVGIPFAFGILTNDMKEQFRLTQGNLSTITTFGSIFGCFSLPAGIMWDRVGPKPVLVCGGVSVSLGFFLLYLAFNGTIPGTMPVLLVIQFFLALTSGWMDIASLMTNLFSFPLNNGDVVILQKTFMGLGGTMVASYYTGWFKDDIRGYCLFISGYTAVILAAGTYVLDLPKYVYAQRAKQKEESGASTGAMNDGGIVSSSSDLEQSNAKGRRMGEADAHLSGAMLVEGKETSSTGYNKAALSGETESLLRTDTEHKKETKTRSADCGSLEADAAFLKETRHLLRVPADRRRIRVGFVLLALLMIHLTVTSLLVAYLPGVDLNPTIRAWFAGITLLLGFSFYCLPFISTGQVCREAMEKVEEEARQSAVPTATVGTVVAVSSLQTGSTTPHQQDPHSRDVTASKSMDSDYHHQQHNQQTEDASLQKSEDVEENLFKYDTKFWESIRKPDLWLMWWYSFCVWGTGSTIIGNSSVLYKALNDNQYNSQTNALFVAVIGLGSAFGRIICGLIEQKHLTPKQLATTWLYPIPPVLTILGLLGFLVFPVSALIVPYTLLGAGFGWSWATTVLTVRRCFKYDVGTHYNFIFTAPMISAILMNRGIFGSIYDHWAAKQGRTINCSGAICVSTSLLIMAGLCLTALGASALVHRRWVAYLALRNKMLSDE